jgi:DNA/RNA-binding domain of Phe-tRNA-synthetase-like protein
MKLYAVMLADYGELKLNATSFMTTEENHLLFLDDEGEVCARFQFWTGVMEIKVVQ